MATVTIEMTVKQYKKLAEYLEVHEDDIANRINDFDMLEDIFFLVFDTHAKKHIL
jgi:hypothetical protein